MARSQSKIKHIQEANKILENRLLLKKRLMEYDIDDDNMNNFFNELTSDGGQEIMNEIGITVTQETKPENVVESLNNKDICQYTDMESYAEQKFGSKIREKFGDKAQELLGEIVKALKSFVEMIKNFSFRELKQFYKTLKAKKAEAEQKVDDSDKMVVEFFGTSMAIVTLGSFAMPALVLTIISVTLVTLLGIWLISELLCAINISFKSVRGCSITEFEWGKCK